jgi:ubiquinone/menaquinone biosynthesis C-methylase UbiE
MRRLLKLVHPEGIPWPGTLFYNAISSTRLFQSHYELIAKDIVSYCEKGSLLDIGTGTGWLLLKLHQESPKLHLVGIDASPSMVTQARKNMMGAGLADRMDIKEGNASSIPFPNECFDIVVSTGSIHHWKEPEVGLNEVYRVLKDKGYALMYDLVSDTPEAVLKEIRNKFGRLRTMLFWLHGFEEPFYNLENFGALPLSTLFKEGRCRFVGLMCCLTLKKEVANRPPSPFPSPQ